MKKFLLLILLTLVQPGYATSGIWVDGNGNSWTMQEVKKNWRNARSSCQRQDFLLPKADQFFEAIDFGLLDPEFNPEFGEQAKKIDWIWLSGGDFSGSVAPMAWRYEEVAYDVKSERHWALCVLPESR